MNHSYLLHHLPASSTPRHSGPVLPPPPSTVYAPSASSSSGQYHHHIDWRSQAPLQSTLFAGPLAPSSWTNAAPSFWQSGPPDFLLPFHNYPPKDYGADAPYPVARSDTSSAVSRDSDLSPAPSVAEVVCNAPLVAPVPLPYHSPTFLMYDLPDEDEDLSHPPYTHRPHKRKRARDEDDREDEQGQEVPAKRRFASMPGSQEAGHTWANAAASAPRQTGAAGFSRRNRAR
ncbi:hypothetical protein BV20DRAFT_960918 [Pilatotrama ljubarskyi]|nr:hypothetical protein BV20DRAFT_960918 [Pilatotrama ljubarskyi]